MFIIYINKMDSINELKNSLKTQFLENLEKDKLVLDLLYKYKDIPMTKLENQIMCMYENDFLDSETEITINQFSIIEKVYDLYSELKSCGLIKAFLNCELYTNYFNFHTELTEEEYYILAIKYIVKTLI